MYSNDYLLKNGITDIEELVGKSVYLIFPVQGIVRYKIRRVQYGKQQEWCLCVQETYKVSELGKSIFFTKEEAKKYQLQQLDKYTNEQRERIIKQKIEERNKELEEFDKLSKKYPTPESRMPINNTCCMCSHIDEVNSPVYLCTICVKQNMFDYNMDKVKKLFGEVEDDKF
jgi:hypothetical protein